IRHTIGDGLSDRRHAAVAPQPMLCCQIRPKRGALSIGPMAPGAGRPALAMEDLLAEGDLVLGLPRRCWKIGGSYGAGIGMDAFRRLGLASDRSGRFIHRSRGGSRRDPCRLGIAVECHAPDPSLLVVGNIERSLQPRGECSETVRRL